MPAHVKLQHHHYFMGNCSPRDVYQVSLVHKISRSDTSDNADNFDKLGIPDSSARLPRHQASMLFARKLDNFTTAFGTTSD